MIDLDNLLAHAPLIAAIVIGVPLIALLRRDRRGRDDAAVLREAGLYRGPVAGRSGEVRER